MGTKLTFLPSYTTQNATGFFSFSLLRSQYFLGSVFSRLLLYSAYKIEGVCCNKKGTVIEARCTDWQMSPFLKCKMTLVRG